MIARFQRITTLLLLILVCFGSTYFALTRRYVAGIAVPSLVLLGYGAFLASEFVLARRQEVGSMAKPPIRDALRAWLIELVTAPAVFCWRQPFRWHTEPDQIAASPSGARGVVLIHGFLCNRGFWNPWLKKLRIRRIPCIAVTLEPVFGSIDAYGDLIDSAVRRLHVLTGRSVIVVAHSMGGLAARAWLRRTPGADRLVERVVTIATPHGGTALAGFARTANGRQMRLDSPWLRALAADETEARRGKFICFFGNCDNITFPTSAAVFEGADNRHVVATAHVRMAFHDDVFDEVVRRVRDEH